MMHGVALLSDENKRLHVDNERQKRKWTKRCSYVASGGILAVEQGRWLAEEITNGDKGSEMLSSMTEKSHTQRLCGKCRLAGHNARTCSGIRDSTRVII